MDNHIFILSDIGKEEGETSLQDVREQYKPKAKTVVIHINSNGGDVSEGKAMYDFIKEMKQEVHTIGEGMVASIATLPFLAGNIRELKPNCQFLAHLPSVQAEGNSDDMLKLSQYMQQTKLDIASIYAQYSDKNTQELIDFMRLDTPISATEAKEMGFATVVQEFKAVAKFQTETKMSTEAKTSKLDRLAAELTEAINTVGNLIKGNSVKAIEEVPEVPAVENISVELKEGGFLFIVSEDGELAGKVAYIADAEGNKTDQLAPAGTHDLIDGRKVTIGEEGIIESVSEAVAAKEDDEEEEDLKAQLDALKKENEELKNTKSETDTKLEEMDLAIKNLNKTVVGSLKVVPKANAKPGKPVEHVNTPMDDWAQKLKESYN